MREFSKIQSRYLVLALMRNWILGFFLSYLPLFPDWEYLPLHILENLWKNLWRTLLQHSEGKYLMQATILHQDQQAEYEVCILRANILDKKVHSLKKNVMFFKRKIEATKKEKAKFKELARRAEVYTTKKLPCQLIFVELMKIWSKSKRIIKPLLRSLIMRFPNFERKFD